ncbi:MAG TPA: hypothetical protein VEN79_16105 [Terriglobia bacterium]|nr:hypothetical protein [Terriglobia bacterium]
MDLKLYIADYKVITEQERARRQKKDVKNEGRSDYVYENKDTGDNLSGTKDGISTLLNAILHRNTRILQKPSAL